MNIEDVAVGDTLVINNKLANRKDLVNQKVLVTKIVIGLVHGTIEATGEEVILNPKTVSSVRSSEFKGLIVRGERRLYMVRHSHMDWFVQLVQMIAKDGVMLPDHSATRDLGVYFDAYFEEYGDNWEVLEDWENIGGS